MTELRQRWLQERADLLRQGELAGKAAGILTVLLARGLDVSEAVRARILSCKDLQLLDRWLARAVTAASDTDVIAA